ncbi:hypothetical protein DICSQDRAFT_147722 [Dichomitus squalens LYAD-421 SS1]|uniref:Glycoside hydrolase family 44 catalytic domain-containing protein n=1 Tax=Dichomitus squalens (strain LYAD-421) TaxID=732165 RepID=R7SXD5_DICSQ|nr:uncharacterized protein DICSQDRAFT_147722 [Dichomitus squalens LYAD-421 SS1]EJF60741.1 hypothetical protein DICSQDRAFT_147722 [Dichomitus squalens LYAD-421 SS1]
MLSWVLTLAVFAALGRADVSIFTDGAGGLSAGWEDWSWGSTLDYASTAIAGRSALSVNSTAYSAFSAYSETVFGTSYAGLRFDVAGSAPDVSISLSSTADSDSSESIALSALSKDVNPTSFTTVTINFQDLPDGTVLTNDTWNRITFQGGANGAVYWLDNIVLLSEIVVTPTFFSAEPLLGNIVAVTSQGAVDFSTVSVNLNGETVPTTLLTTYTPPDTPSKSITYFQLSKSFETGTVLITAGNTTYNYTLPKLEYAALTLGNTKPISSDIYGVNFPADANYIDTLGITLSRWGGNAVTAYNYEGDFTNAGNDWYFENRISSPTFEPWHDMVKGAGSKSIVTVPALDWVAKDDTSYSYPKSLYPDQASFDPYNPDAGDGAWPNGTQFGTAPPQTNVYKEWNVTNQIAWLNFMSIKPDIITVDNEIEIASSTHEDMHPAPMDYDEELSRVLSTANAAKNTLPDVLVAAPSTCAWWYYWTSVVGYTDNAAHDNIDFLPWFLTQMKDAESTYGNRLLDYLDIHYYFGADTSGTDAATQALKLRMTRSLWDPSYIDESYIGTSVPPQWHQPNPNAVWLIPRMQALIEQNYPGTKLSVSEWSAPDNDVTGGLVTADALGIFGAFGLDAATYWGQPAITDGPALAYWLYRGAGVPFGSSSVQVTLSQNNTDTLGVYASSTDSKNVALVIINKDTQPLALDVANLPTGEYTLKHFGGNAGLAKWVTTVDLSTTDYLVVPAWTAVFLGQS